MFQELLDKASLVGHKMAVYRILTKDAQTLTAEDLEELSAMVSEAAALEFVDSRFLLEETALSLCGLLEGEKPPERQRFYSACAAVMGELEGALPEGELAGLADCLEAFRGLRRDGTAELQEFYRELCGKLGRLAPGRYCRGMFLRRTLDTVMQLGRFPEVRGIVQEISENILLLDEDSFEKSTRLNNEFMQL